MTFTMNILHQTDHQPILRTTRAFTRSSLSSKPILLPIWQHGNHQYSGSDSIDRQPLWVDLHLYRGISSRLELVAPLAADPNGPLRTEALFWHSYPENGASIRLCSTGSKAAVNGPSMSSCPSVSHARTLCLGCSGRGGRLKAGRTKQSQMQARCCHLGVRKNA